MRIYKRIVFACTVVPMILIGVIFTFIYLLFYGMNNTVIMFNYIQGEGMEKFSKISDHIGHILFLIMLFIIFEVLKNHLHWYFGIYIVF